MSGLLVGLVANAWAVAPDWRLDGASQDHVGYLVHLDELTNDGFSDVLVNRDQVLELYPGSATGPASAPAWTSEVRNDRSGAVAAGDFDRDGYPDLAVTDYAYGGAGVQTNGRVMVYHGSSTGLEAVHSWEDVGMPSERLGASIARIDLNVDGYDDLVYNALGYSGVVGSSLYAAYGGPAGLGAPVAIDADASGATTFFVAAVGDVNGDGREEYALNTTGTNREVWSAARNGPTRLWSYANRPGEAYVFDAGGDIDGDGYDDLVGTYQTGSMYVSYSVHVAVFYGSAAGLPASASWQWTTPSVDDASGGVLAVGDTNGDTRAELWIGAGSAGSGGKVYAFAGRSGALPASPDLVLSAPASAGAATFGGAVAVGGDTDGDGIDDVIIGAQNAHANGFWAGAAVLFFGR